MSGIASARPVAFAIPGDLSTRTGGYAYDRQVLARLKGDGLSVSHLALPGSFPKPTEQDVAEVVRSANQTAPGSVLLIDGLAFGALPEHAVKAIQRPIVALCHHPLGLEAGLDALAAAELVATERAALSHAAMVIVTSAATARLVVKDFDVPESRIHIAEPGTEPAPRAPRGGRPTRLLAVGSLVPRKGYEPLLRALATIADRAWTMRIIGAERSPGHGADLLALRHQLGLETRVDFAGEADDGGLAAAYQQADIFVMPSLFEGFGMVLTEALARGLPIVATTGGAAADTVPDAAALKVPPGDAQALADALARLMDDISLQDRLSDAAWTAAAGLTRWDDTASGIARVLKGIPS